MGKTPTEEGRTRSKTRKRRAQRRPATRKAAAASDHQRTTAKRRRNNREDLVAQTVSATPKKEARVRGRSVTGR
jgi:hypothetical protein